jgi:hypothetical protein
VIVTLPGAARPKHLSPPWATAAPADSACPSRTLLSIARGSDAQAIQLEDVVRCAHTDHSLWTFSNPRNKNCGNPRTCLICPMTGFDDPFARCDKGLDVCGGDRGQTLVRAIARVGEHLRRPVPRLMRDGGDHRHELFLVIDLVRHGLAHDQLQLVDRFFALSELLERLGPPVELVTTEALSPFIGLRILAKRKMPFESPDYLRHILVQADYLVERSAGLSYDDFALRRR